MIHHINGNKLDDNPKNLEIVTSHQQHMKRHPFQQDRWGRIIGKKPAAPPPDFANRERDETGRFVLEGKINPPRKRDANGRFVCL
jgi:hypothetical protein